MVWAVAIYPAAYFGVALLFFLLIQKVIFGIMNRRSAGRKITLKDIWGVYSHGVSTDLIVASYLTALPLILSAVKVCWPGFPLTACLWTYNILLIVAIGLITVADSILYGFWQSKLDASIFQYLRSFKGAFASVSGLFLFIGFSCAGLVGLLYCLTQMWVYSLTESIFPGEFQGWLTVGSAILLLTVGVGALFLIIRGLKIRPNNPSIAFYSNVPFFNHWALNPAYSLIYSAYKKDEYTGRFRSFEPEECDRILAPLFPAGGEPGVKLLNTQRPNILLIVWESLGAEFVGSLGGKPGVTPNIDRLAREGVMFTQCTAGSFRTDRGLVCLLSGLPGQPTASVMHYTRKLPGLPALPRRLRQEGYVTTAVHGGPLSIMHKSDYYLASGHDTLVSQKELPSSAPAGKWGIHDHWMFDWLYDDIMAKTARGERWMTTFQTLSSHEPFKVPYKRLDDEIDNSFAYVDDAFGRFVDRLKETPAWNDTLIIVVADHGFNRSNAPIDRKEYAHIPLLMVGGAIDHPAAIDTIMSQTDLPAILLGQMGMDHSEFAYSRDILSADYRQPFAFHTFNNGFMYTDPTGTTVYDNDAGVATSGPDPERERKAKAILQKLYEDISKL